MADAVFSSYSPKATNQNEMSFGVADPDISIDEGDVVTPDPGGGGVIFALAAGAEPLSRAQVVGIAVSAAEQNPVGGMPGQRGKVNVRYAGPVTLSTAQWDAVTGQSGGLTQGATYYLSTSQPGGLQTAEPSGGDYIVVIGFAISATTLMLQIQPAVPTIV